MRKFDSKDYEEWCKKNGKEVDSLKSLEEFKKENENIDEGKVVDYNLGHFINMFRSLICMFAKNNDKARESLEKEATKYEEKINRIIESGNKQLLFDFIEIMGDNLGNEIIHFIKTTKTTIDITEISIPLLKKENEGEK